MIPAAGIITTYFVILTGSCHHINRWAKGYSTAKKTDAHMVFLFSFMRIPFMFHLVGSFPSNIESPEKATLKKLPFVRMAYRQHYRMKIIRLLPKTEWSRVRTLHTQTIPPRGRSIPRSIHRRHHRRRLLNRLHGRQKVVL